MISAKKLLLAGGKVAQPFSRSGSFEAGPDGWSLSNGAERPSNLAHIARTGNFVIRMREGQIFYFLPAPDVEGLFVTVSFYWRQNTSRSEIHLGIRQNSDSFVEVTPSRQQEGNYFLIRHRLRVGLRSSLSIRLRAVADGFIDDWSISGART